MGRQVNLSFPASNTTAVAPLQSDAVTPFVFSLVPYDGTNDSTRYPAGVISFTGYARKISLTSANDNHLVNFTIVGTLISGIVISEVLAGPNANTVESVNIYATVTSITPSAAYSAVSAGTGSSGVLSPVALDPYPSVMSWAININVTGTIVYSVTGTLDKLYNPTGTTIALNPSPNVFAINASLTGANSAQYYTSTQQVAALYITIVSSAGGSLVGTILQQGGGY